MKNLTIGALAVVAVVGSAMLIDGLNMDAGVRRARRLVKQAELARERGDVLEAARLSRLGLRVLCNHDSFLWPHGFCRDVNPGRKTR